MSGYTNTFIGKGSEEQVTPDVPATLIVVYRPSDGQPIAFSRKSLAHYNSSMLQTNVIDKVPYSFLRR